jgi:hypothetical protein
VVESVKPRSPLRAEPGLSQTVVDRPLVRVGQHGVGLGGLLEPLFGLLVAGVLVGVEPDRGTAIGLLDLGQVRVPIQTQDLVVLVVRQVVRVPSAAVEPTPRRNAPAAESSAYSEAARSRHVAGGGEGGGPGRAATATAGRRRAVQVSESTSVAPSAENVPGS